MSLSVTELVLPLAEFTLDVTFAARARSTALFGPSGAGKTTLLELIAGLRKPQSGRIELHGRVVAGDGIFIAPRHRRVGYVPQDDALFPHLSVRRNIEYGARTINDDVISILELTPVLDRGVKRLSGGERKRVALARALLTQPEVLLLDEPLAGVDVALRDRVLDYLVRVHDELAIPTIYVTHHLDEARVLCEDVVTLERGRVISQTTI
jgi:molybdate transport system ATP-binding protein